MLVENGYNCVCVLFGADQWVYHSFFLKTEYNCQLLLEMTQREWTKTVKLRQISKQWAENS